MASNWQKRAYAIQQDPHHTLIRNIAYNVRRAWMRHPENEELRRLWNNLSNRLKERARVVARERTGVTNKRPTVNNLKNSERTGKLSRPKPTWFSHIFGGTKNVR